MRIPSILSLSLLVAACGGGSSAAPTTTPAPTEAEAAPAPSSSEQSFAEALRIVCDAPTQCCADMAADGKASELASWITERVTNPDATKLLQSFGELQPADRRPRFVAALGEAQIAEADCAFLQMLPPAP